LPKEHRLTSARDFKAVFARGRPYAHGLVIVKVLRSSPAQPSRFAFSTSAKLGKPVARNRAKRLLREAVRLLGDRIVQQGYDAVLIARPPVREAGFAEVSQAVQELLRKAGLIQAENVEQPGSRSSSLREFPQP